MSYTERLDLYFTANGIAPDAAEQRRAILLSVCGPATYQLIRNLVSPAKPTDKTFAELVALVKEHQQPTPSFIVQRYHFNTRVQRPGESISEFVAQLRKISEHCRYGDSLDDMLRDRLVCGCLDKRLQCKLLADPELTFAKALATAKAMATAERSAKDLHGESTGQVHLMRRRPARNRRSGPPKAQPQVSSTCSRCGAAHSADSCKYKSATCHYCKKPGHLAKVCRKKAKDLQSAPSGPRTHQLDASDTVEEYSLYYSSSGKPQPLLVSLRLNNVDVSMEVDTGAALSVISEQTYRELWPNPELAPTLKPSTVKLKTYTGESIGVKGTIDVHVAYLEQESRLNLLVVAGTGPSLMGRDWISRFRLDWETLNTVRASPDSRIQEVLDRHSDIFKEELGHIKGAPVTLHTDPSQQPRFFKARPVPYALRTKIETELSRLQGQGVIEPVSFSDWAAPIVPVVKGDGTIRICGDYKLTVNAVAQTDSYPLPRIEDIFASLSNGKTFTKLDLAHAYQQIPVAEDTKKLTTINTHKGLFQYTRLPFGVASAPALFQRTMDSILQGLPHVCVYIDDILITGPTDEDHLKTLDEVLSRLEAAGARLKREKCFFMKPHVEYLGHRISAEGLQPTDTKVKALKDAPVPRNVSQLKSFLGLLNYYGKFVPNLSTALAPLHLLLQKRVAWTWGPEQQHAFNQVKSALTSDRVLAHYDPSKELILACDASPYGVGGVLSHKLEDGSERPIAFASRSLAPAEKKYSQLDKEGLAIVFGVKRFHQYLVGRHFTILSDHKPLQHLFQESRGVPTLASARIQRWALILGAYNYSIQYKPGPDHTNADVLSRLPLPESATDIPTPGETTLVLNMLESLPVTSREIRRWTDRDPVLSRVRLLLQKGWKYSSEPALKPYQHRHTELSLLDGCVLWGTRVVVPPPGRDRILCQLHEGHPGISRMKSLARSFVWWPGLDKALEDKVKACEHCQHSQHLPVMAPIQPWEWPERPWSRLHVDYAGPLRGHMFLVVVDAHSKWMEVRPVKSATSTATISQLRAIFATHGIPELLVSDNGSAFTSSEFEEFMRLNGIRHSTSAPYHPATNGLAERAVQTFKTYLKKAPSMPLEDLISRFLLTYRITPHSTTGTSPAELLFSRRPRTRLDLVLPDVSGRVRANQQRQKQARDKHTKHRFFRSGDAVFVCDLPSKKDWLSGTICRSLGTRSYLIRLEDGRTVRRHVDHLIARTKTDPSQSKHNHSSVPEWTDLPDSHLLPARADPIPNRGPSPPPLRRSTRVSIPPNRYM